MSETESIRRLKHSESQPVGIGRSKSEAPRVYIVSNVRLYREGLITSLAAQGQLEVVGAAGSGDFLGQVAALRPNALLLDLAARDSLSIPLRAQQVLPSLRVVAFAVEEVEENVLACAEAGISGYVTQDGSIEDLVAAVLRALRGELMCSPRMTAFLFSRMATLRNGRPTPAGPEGARLTPREREVAALVACNLPNKEIARYLGLGPTTVRNHVHNVLQKLSVHRRGDVARLQTDGNRWRVDTATSATERSGASA